MSNLEQSSRYRKYLTQFEYQLRDLSSIDRARLIIEADRLIREKTTVTSTDQSFRQLGSPHALARQLRQNMGISPQLPRRQSRNRVIVVLLGLLVAAIAIPVYFAYQFIAPFFDMDFTSTYYDGQNLQLNKSFPAENIVDFQLNAHSGQFDFIWKKEKIIKLDCTLSDNFSSPFLMTPIQMQNQAAYANFPGEANCEIQLPTSTRLNAELDKGKLGVIQPKSAVTAMIKSGKIQVMLAESENYSFQLNVDRGEIQGHENLPQTNSGKSLALDFKVESGNIEFISSY